MVSFKLMLLVLAGQLVYGAKVKQPKQKKQQKDDTLSAATLGFSQRLYQKVALDKSNIVYSPYSIHAILTMTSLGAKENTEKEMLETLGVKSRSKVSAAYENFTNEINSVQDVTINIGNAIFVNPEVKIKSKFAKEAETKFSATTKNFDLSSPGGPEKAINDYIAEATKNLIKDIVSEGSITADTAMVLVNTIFFNGTWEYKFGKAYKEKFFKNGGKKAKKINTMSVEMDIKHKKDETNEVDVAELPFQGGRFALYIALPEKLDGIASLEKSLSGQNEIDQLFTGLSKKTVFVQIPKFTTESTLDLNEPLRELGMVEAFDSGADFSRITTSRKIFISQVIHKAKIEVTETGVTAAAATYVGLILTSAPIPKPINFKADHPFLYFLRDNQSGQILFQGKFSG
ncbi:antichymotrypsin-2-like [Physella acuta]|uniref:antichymotrypsin-2-like n=1 Tax=Physella acuta TaxID=109671 RepID=UPI0027DE1FEC|nr:antichymotrypsin-2-like [Physella acuta]XP_059168244.1 antichymotrypsin-2-like [Physella acuta]